ncbi:unnamed protein product (macronuclear) [Paramecium tetraurelia]|uniref:Chromosome undetermined scaffold_1, whole genome shotgun sequence n=1 Tax=Paramecium tetraurelia TaxID=5888 RepID=Q6BGD2_PARTE|nr:hypothetical protein [Paramecium tetraurelia strain d4-2]XP_001423415.1 uncharacterized protein GSPATT00000452001 [Paramecium tetraurelia]CAH03288.1 hypothetical protein PTMB.91c [Paramecium tetraurelia]CAK56017.1 unnamed protein product [Paramecium tetraurelia]|eukprot:XP_001423415.1 hypothetical protein (macronuclear) [Paramecium tetraurelia strain d4-2]
MGAVCQYQQIGSETYFNQETQQYFPISKELKPKSINSSIKHDLKAKYLDIECQFCEKPLMREIASQTKISYNKNQSVKLRKNRSNPQKKKRNQKSKDKIVFENLEQNEQRSLSQTSKTQNKLHKCQSYKKKGKDQYQDFQPYIVLINSQKESKFSHQTLNQIKN